MPQVFEVLRCFKCFVFQVSYILEPIIDQQTEGTSRERESGLIKNKSQKVHQTKKANKFVCKMCGEKQSIKRNYGLGTGQECRVHVQKLNGIRKELDESKSFEENPTSDEEENSVLSVTELPRKIESKWAEYAKSNENVDTTNLTEDKMFLNDTEVVLEVPKKKRQRRTIVNYKNKTSKTKSEMVDADDTDTECQETSCNLEMNVLSKQNPCGPTRQEKLFAQATTNNRYSQKTNLIDETVELKSKDCNPTLKNNSDALNQKKIKQSFVPPVVNTNSKWFQFSETDLSIARNKTISETDSLSNNNESQFSSYSEHDSAESENSNIENGNYNECISTSIDKNSQCLRLTEDHRNISNENQKESTIETISKLQNNPHSLFSLCDDSDIDNLLDI